MIRSNNGGNYFGLLIVVHRKKPKPKRDLACSSTALLQAWISPELRDGNCRDAETCCCCYCGWYSSSTTQTIVLLLYEYDIVVYISHHYHIPKYLWLPGFRFKSSSIQRSLHPCVFVSRFFLYYIYVEAAYTFTRTVSCIKYFCTTSTLLHVL